MDPDNFSSIQTLFLFHENIHVESHKYQFGMNITLTDVYFKKK